MEILMKRGERKRLMEDFNVSKPTVIAALRGESDTKLANMLRKAALERGGVIVGAAPVRLVKTEK